MTTKPNGNDSTKTKQDFFLLSNEAAENLTHFQYKGEDRSLLYRYVLSPLATFLVERATPRWLAPNTITLVGLAFMVASYLIMWYYVPTWEEADDAPRWIFLFNGIAILVYQTLDNMDGKQARRTGSSSPLGLLFDHGCDAINPLFGSVNWMISMSLNPASDPLLCFIILFGPYSLFYIGTWEEYYTGELIMPAFNGPNEGLLGGAMLSFTSFFYGPQYWLGDDWWMTIVLPVAKLFLPETMIASLPLFRNADLLLAASSFGFLQEVTIKMLYVARKFGPSSLLNVIPFATLVSCAIAIDLLDDRLWLDCIRTSFHLSALLFAEMVVDLMVKHMTLMKFQPFRWPLLPLVAFTVMVATDKISAGKDAQDYLLCYVSILATYFSFKCAILIHEICSILRIYCFDIVSIKKTK